MDTMTMMLMALTGVAVTALLVTRRPRIPGYWLPAGRLARDDWFERHALLAERVTWPAPGRFAVKVVGEASYQAALSRIADLHGEDVANELYIATLTPDDGNPHDSHAIKVSIMGLMVGYLATGDTPEFRARLRGKVEATTCLARISGSVNAAEDTEPEYRVALDLDLRQVWG